MIASIVEQKKPAQGEKGQYGKKRAQNAEHASAGGEYAGALDAKNESLPAMAGMLGIQGIPDMISEMSGMVGIYSSLGGPLHTPASGPFNRPAINNTPAEEEMDDTEDGSEWAVRVGNDTPPQWGKRRAEEVEEDPPIKRQRTMSVSAAVVERWLTDKQTLVS